MPLECSALRGTTNAVMQIHIYVQLPTRSFKLTSSKCRTTCFHAMCSSITHYSVACSGQDRKPLILPERDVDVPLAFTQSLTDSEGGQG